MGKLLEAASLLACGMSRGCFSTQLFTVFVDIWKTPAMSSRDAREGELQSLLGKNTG
jgi:hypothetical protein